MWFWQAYKGLRMLTLVQPIAGMPRTGASSEGQLAKGNFHARFLGGLGRVNRLRLPGPSAMRVSLIALASIALALFALCEVGMAYPVGWLYLSVAVAFAAGTIRPVSARSQLARLGAVAVIIAVVAALYLVEWTTRKPFLRDLDRIRVGMTEAEVREMMGRYMEGSRAGQPFPAFPRVPALNIVGNDWQYSTETSPSGQMVIRDSLVFRHSSDGAFNSDWHHFAFERQGRDVEFSPD